MQNPEGGEGFLWNLIKVAMIVAIGFGVGFFLMHTIKPELFGGFKDSLMGGYFDELTSESPPTP